MQIRQLLGVELLSYYNSRQSAKLDMVNPDDAEAWTWQLAVVARNIGITDEEAIDDTVVKYGITGILI